MILIELCVFLTVVTMACRTAFFGVYKSWGPGANSVGGVSWEKELDYETAHPFIAKSFVNGRLLLMLEPLFRIHLFLWCY